MGRKGLALVLIQLRQVQARNLLLVLAINQLEDHLLVHLVAVVLKAVLLDLLLGMVKQMELALDLVLLQEVVLKQVDKDLALLALETVVVLLEADKEVDQLEAHLAVQMQVDKVKVLQVQVKVVVQQDKDQELAQPVQVAEVHKLLDKVLAQLQLLAMDRHLVKDLVRDLQALDQEVVLMLLDKDLVPQVVEKEEVLLVKDQELGQQVLEVVDHRLQDKEVALPQHLEMVKPLDKVLAQALLVEAMGDLLKRLVKDQVLPVLEMVEVLQVKVLERVQQALVMVDHPPQVKVVVQRPHQEMVQLKVVDQELDQQVLVMADHKPQDKAVAQLPRLGMVQLKVADQEVVQPQVAQHKPLVQDNHQLLQAMVVLLLAVVQAVDPQQQAVRVLPAVPREAAAVPVLQEELEVVAEVASGAAMVQTYTTAKTVCALVLSVATIVFQCSPMGTVDSTRSKCAMDRANNAIASLAVSDECVYRLQVRLFELFSIEY
jgi:hypothetical protein